MNIQERVAEVISNIVWQPLATKSDIPIAASEIIKLLEAENKTLTLLAADLDIPLWKAMKIANYGKKANVAMVNEVGKDYLAEIEKGIETEVSFRKDQLSATYGKRCIKEFLRRLK